MIKLCKTTARLSLDASIVCRCCSLAIDKEFMNYKNRLRGAITQVSLKSLLENASCRTVPSGIEEVLRELSSLEQEHYKQLNLPPALRYH